MKLYTEGNNYKLYDGNMLDMLDVLQENSIDAIVTDPPYELNFMGKSWDSSGIAFNSRTWEKCLSVLKPGGYLLCFGASRNSHRVACAIEDAGFEIRDNIMWLYGSGMPKSLNVGLSIDRKLGVESEIIGRSTNGSGAQLNKLDNHGHGDTGIGYADGSGKEFDIKQPTSEEAKPWKGWGTALKPAYESIIVARKPCEGSTTDNVLKYGVGGINIDECRVPMEQSDADMLNAKSSKNPQNNSNPDKIYGKYDKNIATTANEQGRFPANVILTYDDSDFDEVCGGMPDSDGCKPHRLYSNVDKYEGWGSSMSHRNGDIVGYDDCGGSAARYFYCAKASRLDRDEGLPDNIRNTHPTLKPVSLMRYLVRLVSPKGSIILDPFNGSGSTGKAIMFENRSRNADYKYIGIDLSDEYLSISKARIEYAMTADMTIEEDGAVKLSKPVKQKHKTFNLFEL
jgi:site-specific DNA-methyltransferase (adenine-specific)